MRLTLGIKKKLHLNSINELVFVDSGNGNGLLISGLFLMIKLVNFVVAAVSFD